MAPSKPELLRAFQEDHAILGRGFSELSRCLRAGDAARACAVARRLNDQAGAHIAFEEQDFYPALVPVLGEDAVRRMREEHDFGFAAIRTLLQRPADVPLDRDLTERLLEHSEAMEDHIAECGELFAAMGRLAPDVLEALYRKLLEWRHKRPSLYAEGHIPE